MPRPRGLGFVDAEDEESRLAEGLGLLPPRCLAPSPSSFPLGLAAPSDDDDEDDDDGAAYLRKVMREAAGLPQVVVASSVDPRAFDGKRTEYAAKAACGPVQPPPGGWAPRTAWVVRAACRESELVVFNF